MATRPPPGLDTITVASVAIGVALAALAAAIATLQAATAAFCEHTVGTVAAAGAPVGTTTGATAAARPNPPTDPPFVAAGASAPLAPPRAPSAPWPLQPPLATLRPAFFAAPQYGLKVQPAWPSSLDPSMGGAPHWSTSHAFFAAP
jgi:hypothetical protein